MGAKKRGELLVACGGTFGHIRPALTVADAMKRKGYKVTLFCGSKDRKFPLISERPESETFFLNMRGFPKSKNILQWLQFVFLLFFGFCKTGKYFLLKKPAYVVASGSFISFPPLFWAKLLRIPYSILEQNSTPGFVSRLFFQGAKHIFFALPPTNQTYLKQKVAMVTGNPLDLKQYTREQAQDFFSIRGLSKYRKVVGIIGGSLGAKSLVEWAISQKKLLDNENYFIFCITGNSLFEKYKNEEDFSLKLVPFVKDISYFYGLCDFIVARAGASTISELIYFQKTVMFIPYPFATKDHQTWNAIEATKYIPGEVVQEKDFGGYSIKQVVENLSDKERIFSPEKSQEWAQALEKIVNILVEEI